MATVPKKKKKKPASVTPNEKNAAFVVKSDKDNILRKSKEKGKVRNVRTKAQKIQEKDGRMKSLREEAAMKKIKKDGGLDASLRKERKTKAGLIKYKDRYVSKTSAAGKKALQERARKKKK